MLVLMSALACQAPPPTPAPVEEQQPSAKKPEPLDPEEWKLVAETSEFRATSNYAETMAFMKRLEERMPELKLGSFGVSGEGRELPLAILSKDRAFTPEAARETGLPIVMIQNGIHAGEIDGKDATLMILRDLLFGERRWILDAAILLIVPIYNVDGHERISPHHRPNQDGPLDGMGFRTTARGLDLNRDHMKLVSEEARALVRLYNEWRPHLHVDNHVTNGCDHDWVLTLAHAEHPYLNRPLGDWLAAHVPTVRRALEEQGHRNGPYVWLDDQNDPSKGFSTSMGRPRYSTTYFALRHTPSLLVEMHAYKPYRPRVLANRDFIVELLREIGKEPRALVDAVRESWAETVALGKPGAPPSEVVLSWKDAPERDSISFPIYKWRLEPSVVSGKPLIRYERGVTDERVVPWSHAVVADRTATRPRGYLLLPGWPEIERRLADHGLLVLELEQGCELEVETMRLSNPRHDKESYQGEIPMKADVTRQVERRAIPAGALWIPATQVDFEVAVQLLEPEAPDSLVRWGFLRSVLERKTYIGRGVLEGKAAKLLEDPETAKAWEEALRDPAFAADDRARWLWWYQRTENWDETVGLMPAMRVIGPIPVPVVSWDRSAS